MNKRSLHIVLSLLALIFYRGMNAQELMQEAAKEKITVCTDRTMYISGEEIRFAVSVTSPGPSNNEVFSRIVYCELITGEGHRIAGGKYPLQDLTGSGCLAIPETTVSGIYFLKVYTRFMRNIGPSGYTYLPLKIINPYKTDVLPGNGNLQRDLETPSLPNPNPGARAIRLLTAKTDFSPRETVHLGISVDPGEVESGKLCIAVVPENTSAPYNCQEWQRTDSATFGIYLPETRGISLSGQLVAAGEGTALSGAKAYLSIIGDKDIQVVRTDSAGKFYFALPGYYGSRDLFLCAEELPDVVPELLIDNDFCTRPVTLPSFRFSLSDKEQEAAYRLAVNARVTSLFRDQGRPEPPASDPAVGDTPRTPFYGKPTEVLVMDNYIELPTLEEYFTELVVMVKVKKVQGKKRFRFLSTQNDMSIYDPLVLVDWVAVDTMDKILRMSPRDIDRIELVDAPYVKGDITYGGIVSFVSKKNDFAGIDLPTSGTFVNYQFLDPCHDSIPTGIPSGFQSGFQSGFPSGTLPATTPDARNTVFWAPSIRTDKQGNAALSFTLPDTPGNYRILLRGINRAGERVSVEKKITVSGP